MEALPADPDVAAFDALHDDTVRRDAELRPRLRSGSRQAREEAYRDLVGLVAPMRSFIDSAVRGIPNAAVRAEYIPSTTPMEKIGSMNPAASPTR